MLLRETRLSVVGKGGKMPSVIGKKIPSLQKESHILISRTYELVHFHGKKNPTMMIKLRILRQMIPDYPGDPKIITSTIKTERRRQECQRLSFENATLQALKMKEGPTSHEMKTASRMQKREGNNSLLKPENHSTAKLC